MLHFKKDMAHVGHGLRSTRRCGEKHSPGVETERSCTEKTGEKKSRTTFIELKGNEEGGKPFFMFFQSRRKWKMLKSQQEGFGQNIRTTAQVRLEGTSGHLRSSLLLKVGSVERARQVAQALSTQVLKASQDRDSA